MPDQTFADWESLHFNQLTEQETVNSTAFRDVAESRNLSHYVQVGQANPYLHNAATPIYMDTFENPYAVFVFKYASAGESKAFEPFLLPRTPLTYRHTALLAKMFNIASAESSNQQIDQPKPLLKTVMRDDPLQVRVCALKWLLSIAPVAAKSVP